MTIFPSRATPVRLALAVLLVLVAINAFGGGWYGLSGAPGVPREWLVGTPFDDYRVPSLILLVAVGGSCLAAAVALFARLENARRFAVVAGLTLFTWIAVQVGIIGYVSWLQPVLVIISLSILSLSSMLPSEQSNAIDQNFEARTTHATGAGES